MKTYPNLGSEVIITNEVCDHCNKKKSILLKLEWQTSWMRGDDEFERVCAECFPSTRTKWHRQVSKRKIDKLLNS